MAMTRDQIGALVLRMQDTFFEMPELTLTPRQAQTLFDVDEQACQAVLDVLADAKVLVRPRVKTYMRPRFAAHAA
jgi:hypothetical protein